MRYLSWARWKAARLPDLEDRRLVTRERATKRTLRLLESNPIHDPSFLFGGNITAVSPTADIDQSVRDSHTGRRTSTKVKSKSTARKLIPARANSSTDSVPTSFFIPGILEAQDTRQKTIQLQKKRQRRAKFTFALEALCLHNFTCAVCYDFRI